MMDNSIINATTKISLPLEPNSSTMICGPSNSGKSQFTKKLIEILENMYDTDPPVQVLYGYGLRLILYDEVEVSIKNIQFHGGNQVKHSLMNMQMGNNL